MKTSMAAPAGDPAEAGHAISLSWASACRSQDRMSISRYIVVAVVRCSCGLRSHGGRGSPACPRCRCRSRSSKGPLAPAERPSVLPLGRQKTALAEDEVKGLGSPTTVRGAENLACGAAGRARRRWRMTGGQRKARPGPRSREGARERALRHLAQGTPEALYDGDGAAPAIANALAGGRSSQPAEESQGLGLVLKRIVTRNCP